MTAAATHIPDSAAEAKPRTAEKQRVATSASKFERRQFSMGQDSINRLALLQGRTEATSHSEVIRNALRTYQYLVEEEAAGHRVLVEQDDGTFVRLKML